MDIISVNTLTDKHLRDIKSLESLCIKTDNISFGLFTEPELNENSDMPCFFMIYDNEKTGLLAFLSLFVPGDGTAEVTACTHPNHRQKGLFHMLCKKAHKVANTHNINSLIFAISPTQQIAFNILAKYGAKLENIEYLLQYKATVSDSTPNNTADTFKAYKLVPAKPTNIAVYTDIFAAAFRYPLNVAKDFLTDIFLPQSNIKAFSFHDASGNIIGCCFTEISDTKVMPFGICIHPDAQGKKLGQYMISLLIKDFILQYQKPIFLQVSGSNENALHIYKKLGFVTASQINYYHIDIV